LPQSSSASRFTAGAAGFVKSFIVVYVFVDLYQRSHGPGRSCKSECPTTDYGDPS
jgi:hypothetical protein